MASSQSNNDLPLKSERKSKHALAKLWLLAVAVDCNTHAVDRNEGVEALLTACILDMQERRGSSFTRDYLRYELSSLGSADVYDVQKR